MRIAAHPSTTARDPFGEPEFETEAELVTCFEQVFRKPRGAWAWIREFPTAAGVADLVAVELCNDWRANIAIGEVGSRWAYALHSLPLNVPYSVEQFCELTNATRSTARAVLRRFQEAGYCRSAEHGTVWIKAVAPGPLARSIVAIEAKLSDWRRALYQASQHRDYATSSWVVLDQRALSAANLHVHQFSMRGIGLAGLSARGDLTVATPATNRTPRRPHRLWQANAEIARRLTSRL